METIVSIRQDLISRLKVIDSIPSDEPLPAMPGFDRDHVDNLLKYGCSEGTTMKRLKEAVRWADEWIDALPEEVQDRLCCEQQSDRSIQP